MKATILQPRDDDFYKNLVPSFIYNNLTKAYAQRPYQQEAFGRFVHYFNTEKNREAPTQLLYHMATGSGKTLVMAGLMVYLYQQGYRNFLFFVNSTNIIDKTRDNFLNKKSAKYLFADSISIGQQSIAVKEVSNFQSTDKDEISIVFSTIQGLHAHLNSPKENSITYDDFEDKKMVLISDEAHHINAGTKQGGNTKDNNEKVSWEATATKILHANKDNILLEFTATMDLSIPEIKKKYAHKLLFDYPLKQFRKDGYSKEVQVLQSATTPINRALQAIVLSQYRRKIFEKNKLAIKPVILFKSKTIKESEAFLAAFTSCVQSLCVREIEQIAVQQNGALAKAFHYFKANNITFENLVTELKDDFSAEKLISVNSKDESGAKQLAINSLEDEGNIYRAVFAVDKLNEGWDVLNLFDIVRLYNAAIENKTAQSKTTMSEAQLIGRGARYCPFKITENQPLFTRKYDGDIANELRACEELYYHCSYNPAYIAALSVALQTIGIKAAPNETANKKQQPHTGKKPSPIGTKKNTKGFAADIIGQVYEVSLATGFSETSNAFNPSLYPVVPLAEQPYKLKDFGETIIRKAMNQLPFYQFSNLKNHWPQLGSVTVFISSADYLANIKVTILGTAPQVKQLSKEEKLKATVEVLAAIQESFGQLGG